MAIARRVGLTLLDVLGKAWTLPNTLAGLILGFVALVFGGRWPALGFNAVVFNRFPFGNRAFVLGNVVLNPGADLFRLAATYESLAKCKGDFKFGNLEYVHLGRHEEAHTWQYQVLGPFFIPLYLLSLALPSPTPFEHAADIYARTGKGWWPGIRRRVKASGA